MVPVYDNDLEDFHEEKDEQKVVNRFSFTKKARVIDNEANKPRFHKTKNLLRTISNYFHKFLLHNQRSIKMQRKYF